MPGGKTENWPWGRRFLSRWGNRYAAGVLGLAVNDATAGFRAYRTDALKWMDYETVTADGYGFQIEMTHRMVRAGGKIVEFPIEFRDRRLGELEAVPRHRPGGVRAGRPALAPRPPRSPPPAPAERLIPSRRAARSRGHGQGGDVRGPAERMTATGQ